MQAPTMQIGRRFYYLMNTMPSLEQRKQTLFLFLCCLFLTNTIIAELLGVKIFSVEQLLGIEALQIPIGNQKYDFNMTAGVVNWPIVFITSDLINEYYGRNGVKKISFMAAGFVVYLFLVVFAITLLPPAQFWLEINNTDSQGNYFNMDEAFNRIFSQGLGIMIGSLVAFLLGQLLDISVFAWLRQKTGARHIWLRATGSTLFSQLIDSFLVIGIAFYAFGDWTWSQVTAVGTVNYLYKAIIALLTTPLIYLAHYVINQYLGEKNAEQMTEQAARS